MKVTKVLSNGRVVIDTNNLIEVIEEKEYLLRLRNNWWETSLKTIKSIIN